MKLKGILKTFIIVLAGVLIYYFAFKKSNDANGSMAPKIEADLINGDAYSLSDDLGSYVIIDFWGSWCPPCRKENPKLVDLYKKYKDKKYQDAAGLEILTIALEKDGRRWEKAAQKDGFFWNTQIVQESRFVLTSKLAMKYGVRDVPAKFLIGPKGDILLDKVSLEDIRQYLENHISE